MVARLISKRSSQTRSGSPLGQRQPMEHVRIRSIARRDVNAYDVNTHKVGIDGD